MDVDKDMDGNRDRDLGENAVEKVLIETLLPFLGFSIALHTSGAPLWKGFLFFSFLNWKFDLG